MNPPNNIEIIRFLVSPSKALAFVEAREKVDAEVSQIDGFLGSELCQHDESNWVILIRWENAAKAKAAQTITEKMQSISSWISIADKFLSFETVEVKYTSSNI